MRRCAVDARYTLDGLVVVCHLLLDDAALAVGVERVLHADRNVLHADGVDSRRIYHLRTEVAKLHRLDVAQLLNGVGSLYDARVGGHEAVHVGPNLKNFGVECCGDDGSCIV